MPFAYRNNGIPDRWMDYQAVGKRLPGSRFIAFKVPLKQSLNSHLPCPDVFGPWELLEALGKENEELGLLIDLTYTTRYYKLEDLPDSLLWVKIPTAGHAIPSDATILSFKRVIRRFLRDNANNDKLIGVHCTHGLNRTGYLVCRYLIDVDGVDPKEAVELFNSSRGHTIERQNYLEDLQSGPRRSNEGMEVSELEPMRGFAVRRPSYLPFGSNPREERHSHTNHRYYHEPREERHSHTNHRYYQGPPVQRGPNHHSHHWPPQGGHLPPRPFHPHPPTGPPPPSDRWMPPHPDTEWRRPFYSQETRHRFPPREPEWSSSSHSEEGRRSQETRHRFPPREPEWSSSSHSEEGRRRARYPSAHPYPVLPRYSAKTCWTKWP